MRWMLVLLILPLVCSAGPQELFEQATTQYNQGEFEQALETYSRIEGTSPELEYNVGNTLMRLGRSSEAIAHYRRAQWLAPGDPDIRANLERAAAVHGASIPRIPLLRTLTGWWTPKTWQTVFLGGCWITAATGILITWIPRMKPTALWVLPPLFTLLAVAGAATWASLPSRFTSEGVVRGPEQITRFEPLPDATEQAALPGGTVVQVLESTRNWVRIESGDTRGWIPEEHLVQL